MGIESSFLALSKPKLVDKFPDFADATVSTSWSVEFRQSLKFAVAGELS